MNLLHNNSSYISGTSFILDGEVALVNKFDPKLLSVSVYEAFRVSNRIPLFLEDHLNRLEDSVSLKGIPFIQKQELIEYTHLLIRENDIQQGNIKISILPTPSGVQSWVYQVPHQYPTAEMYQNGVKCLSYPAIRKTPHAKSESDSFKRIVKVLLQENNAFEALLVDENACMSEGTRTNVFLIKNDTIYSAPESTMLLGITRQKVLSVIQNKKIPYLEKPILLKDLSAYDAAFITGTSPHVLPINQIDSTSFNPQHLLVNELGMGFEKLVQTYIEQQQ